MEGGTIVRWLRREGETVQKDEILFELETDKALVEVPAPESGILKQILVREGHALVGKTVAFIGDPGDDVAEVAIVLESQPQAPAPVGMVVPQASLPRPTEPGIIRATPAARRRARDLNVDLTQIQGTGPEGRITQEDVERVAAHKGARAAPASHTGREAIAKRVSDSWRDVPHIHIGGELRAESLRSALEKARTAEPETSITDILLYVLAALLPRFPDLNSVWNGDRAESRREVHLAFAVQTERGVVAPVVHDADRRPLQAISVERRRLTESARAWRLKPDEVERGTFTLTNLGMYPVDFFVPIINHPQCAVLATGRLHQVVELRNGTVLKGERMWVNLAVDHRVADGALAAEFLRELEKQLDALDLHF